MDTFSKTREAVVNQINNVTLTAIDTLTNLWKLSFEPELCSDNLTKLSEHVINFYEEVVDEMKERHERISSEVKNLYDETMSLKEILKVGDDVSMYDNVPLYTMRNVLNDNLHKLREQLKTRRNEIYDLLVEQEKLCEELEEEPRELLDDPLPSADEIQLFRHYLDTLKAVKNNRKTEILNLRQSIRHLCTVLEISMVVEDDIILIEDPEIRPSSSNVKKLHELHDNLNENLKELQESIDKMKSKLEVLWTALETSPSTKKRFDKLIGYDQSIHTRFYQEVERCETERRKNIKKFVDKTREDIIFWWDKTHKSDKEKSKFVNFLSDCYTEDLLTLHEMELEDLKKFYYENEKMFELIEERQKLWDRMESLDAKANEPGRFNNRGGQLLKEEKERKMLMKKIPDMEKHLMVLVQEYEQIHNSRFTINGEAIEDLMEHKWKSKETTKEVLKSARKALQTPFKTPAAVKQSTKKTLPNSSGVKLSTTKRQAAPVPDVIPTKRNILTELQVPNSTEKFKNVLKNSNTKIELTKKTAVKLTIFPGMKPPKTRMSMLKKKNKRVSKIRFDKKKSQNTNLGRAEAPTETTNYDCFEGYILERSPCRSSLVEKNKEKTNLRRSLRNIKENTEELSTPQPIKFDSRLPLFHGIKLLSQTPDQSSSKKLRKLL